VRLSKLVGSIQIRSPYVFESPALMANKLRSKKHARVELLTAGLIIGYSDIWTYSVINVTEIRIYGKFGFGYGPDLGLFTCTATSQICDLFSAIGIFISFSDHVLGSEYIRGLSSPFNTIS